MEFDVPFVVRKDVARRRIEAFVDRYLRAGAPGKIRFDAAEQTWMAIGPDPWGVYGSGDEILASLQLRESAVRFTWFTVPFPVNVFETELAAVIARELRRLLS